MRRFDSIEEYTYTVTWTKNSGIGWYTAAFETREEAREFVAGMLRENEGNVGFSWYAQRMATLDSEDFLDEGVQDVRVRFANPWMYANNGEPDEEDDGGETREDDSDVVRRALLDVIEECRENACGEVASVRLAAMANAALVLKSLS